MLFSSSVFLFVFLPCVLMGYYILLRNRRQGQNLFLLVASLLFYAWGEPRFLPIMLLSIAMNYGFGRWVHRWKFQCRYLTLPVTLTVICNLALLFVFKYLTFTLESLNSLGLELAIPGIRLPIGISFFTFQALSYVLDVAMGKARVQRSILDLGLYISFFPQLIAGPIVKYGDVAEQIRNRQENWENFSAGCSRFLIGLSKKVLIANQVAAIADRAFAIDPDALTTPMAWLGALCYTFQIYYDFSGYSDMAIGLGRMFGFRFLENFDHPYASTSVTEFWRRWHISLGSWFRDYLYIPLGGSRCSKGRLVFNLMAVWTATGIWHGANWNFLLWGIYYGVLLVLEKLVWGKALQKLPAALQHVYALALVLIGWALFAIEDFSALGPYLGSMLGFAGGGLVNGTVFYHLRSYTLILLLAAVGSSPLVKSLWHKLPGKAQKLLCPLLILAGLLLSTAYLVDGTYNPFLYFQF